MAQCGESLGTCGLLLLRLGQSSSTGSSPAKHLPLVYEGRGSLTNPIQLRASIHAEVQAVGGPGHHNT